MAITGFGVTELNLIGSSGTPKIESPNNINLNAVTVAISTNATVGGTLGVTGASTLSGNVAISTDLNVSGISTFADNVNFKGATGLTSVTWNKTTKSLDFVNDAKLRFGSSDRMSISKAGTGNAAIELDTGDLYIKHGSDNSIISKKDGAVEVNFDNVKKIETTTHGVVVTGIVTATSFSGGGNDIVTSRWTIGANGSSDYTFTGPGGLSGANDPTIYLARGQTYEFVNNSGGSHPFQIRVSNGGSAYSTGVTNNGASSGTIKFEVPFAAPNTLVYQCTAHSGMVGNIVVYPSV